MTPSKEYQRDQTLIISLTKADLERVISGETDFLTLLLDKYEEIRFDLFSK